MRRGACSRSSSALGARSTAPATKKLRRIAPLHVCRQSRACFARSHPDFRARNLDSAGLPPHGVDACRLARASSRPRLYRVGILYHDEAFVWLDNWFVTVLKQFDSMDSRREILPRIMTQRFATRRRAKRPNADVCRNYWPRWYSVAVDSGADSDDAD